MTPLSLYSLDLAPDGGGLTRHDPSAKIITATDLGLTRGDGIFETVVIRAGRPQALRAHLDRFQRSARMLDLPVPDRALWGEAVIAAAAHLSTETAPGAVKFAMTRGDEASSIPTGWALGFMPDDPAGLRSAGVRAVLLDRGFRHDVATTSPWLLQGAKTLSYAVNKAALREAVRRGAQEVIFVSSDGDVLEGPSSTVVALIDATATTPPPQLGILPGTTQADVFSVLKEHGVATQIRRLRPADLVRAEAVWLCSSTRGAIPVSALDGAARSIDERLTTLINHGLDARSE